MDREIEKLKRQAESEPDNLDAKRRYVNSALRMGLTNIDADYLQKYIAICESFIGPYWAERNGRYTKIEIEQIDKEDATEKLELLNNEYKVLGLSEGIMKSEVVATPKVSTENGWFPSDICW